MKTDTSSPTKILYKYKGIENIEHIFDILINKCLFCAPKEKLNDPMEGYFIEPNPTEEGIRDMRSSRKTPEDWDNYCIASLSECNDNFLMWSHYASGHSGLVIGIEVLSNDVDPIDYVDVMLTELVSSIGERNNTVRKSLLTKHLCWKYEEEWRVLNSARDHEIYNGNHYYFRSITSVICGSKMKESTREAIGYVCKALGIKLQKALMENGKVRIVDVEA